ncbi:Protein kinase-like domain protein [Niveomyces insectorum RCEF 264]|uniref:Protein kinase-like domain protein n=1 Tax=Niveomyces insectorum RCEF 264 TaxID=1081102 RepID=A0A167W4A5_9HYPO|nr:Protein kinase-like domain protein [Niveomyces insectorum RCEF 264]
MTGIGQTGIVMPLPDGHRVRKAPYPWHGAYDQRVQRTQLRREIDVYHALPAGHRRLVRLLECTDDGQDDVSLVLERMPQGTLHHYLVGGCTHTKPSADELARGRAIARRQRASWALEAADALVLLHAHGVVHADVKPENMVLDAQLRLRLIDFSGCSLRGAPALSLESAPFYMPRTPAARVVGDMGCSVTTDLFALGSSLFQIVAGRPPWHPLQHRAVEERYERGEFPDLATAGPDGTPLPLFADIIHQCWHARMASAEDVLEAIKRTTREAFGPEDRAWIEQQSGVALARNVTGQENQADTPPTLDIHQKPQREQGLRAVS